jgi:hypothetical protein
MFFFFLISVDNVEFCYTGFLRYTIYDMWLGSALKTFVVIGPDKLYLKNNNYTAVHRNTTRVCQYKNYK